MTLITNVHIISKRDPSTGALYARELHGQVGGKWVAFNFATLQWTKLNGEVINDPEIDLSASRVDKGQLKWLNCPTPIYSPCETPGCVTAVVSEYGKEIIVEVKP